ncbi:MAG: PhoH family protein, partial [Xanthomonadales bacterium]|nr:PhoH family protein [Xanthomonadales bacterium]
MKQRLALELEPADTLRLANLCGQFDEHLKQIESRLGVDIFCRGNLFTIQGADRPCRATRRLLQGLYRLSESEILTPELINLHLQETGIQELAGAEDVSESADDVSVKTKRGIIRGRGPNQKSYLRNITRHAINFGVGPAGTGKTYLAVACAVAALQDDQVQRI